MKTFLLRRLIAVLLAGAAAIAVWKALPGTQLDKAAFTGVVRGFANPPFFIAGNGTHAAPWSLRTLSSKTVVDPSQAPFVIAIGDDPDGVFQSSPPTPIDLAVMLSNLRRLGEERVAVSAVMAWQAPDPIGLLALEGELRRFESVLTAAPLARGPQAEALPRAFREASLALSAIHGNAAALPVVNRLPVPGTILGGDGVKAGFTELESEPPGGRMPLLARWDDRVVIAYPLLVVLERENLPLAGVEVSLGNYLRLSAAGPVVPIDPTGRLASEVPRVAASGEVPAESLIDGGDGLIPAGAARPLVLRDDRRAAELPTRRFAADLAGAVAAISSDAGLAAPREFARLPWRWEVGLLAVVVALVVLVGTTAGFKRGVLFFTLAALLVAAQWIAAGLAGIWLPGLAALAALLAAALIGPARNRPAVAGPPPAMSPTPEPPPQSAPQEPAASVSQTAAAPTPPPKNGKSKAVHGMASRQRPRSRTS